MCQEVIGGQYLELLVAQRRAATEEELLRVLRLKSGRYTAERPIQLGALLAGAPPEVLAELSRYGAAVGEAFQLQDDLLGMFGDPDTVGKPVDADLKEGKFTFLIHHALATATPEQRRALDAALGNPEATPEQTAAARRVLAETGARDAVAAMIGERLRSARSALAAMDLEAEGHALPRRADRLSPGARAVSASELRFPEALLGEERDRKAEHIRLALDQRMQLGHSFFDDYRFEPEALPRDRHRGDRHLGRVPGPPARGAAADLLDDRRHGDGRPDQPQPRGRRRTDGRRRGGGIAAQSVGRSSKS